MRVPRRGGRAALVLAAALLACAPVGPRPASIPTATLPEPLPDGRPARVALVSVAGLSPEAALGRGGDAPDMPTLRALARRGVVAEATRTVAPASAYPAHTTLVTGRTPAGHGVPADRRLGQRGVRRARYSDASHVRGDTLWQLAASDGVPVAALDWPATLGAAIPLLLPDVVPVRRGETWKGLLAGSATPWVRAAVERHADPALGAPGPARDALLVDLSCQILSAPRPPALLLLRLSQTEPALLGAGPYGDAARAAFTQVDAELGRLLGCLADGGRMDAALVVVGDRVPLPVHTTIHPNTALADAGLIGAGSWLALSRSNGGSAFVYASDETAALQARRVLEEETAETGTFRIVPATEMIRLGADPDAWFGLEAEPGYVFSDQTGEPRLRPATVRAAGGQLTGAASPAFVAYGRGVRAGVRVPLLRQVDVAPTVASLLGLALPGAEGRALVGLLAVPDVATRPAPDAPGEERP